VWPAWTTANEVKVEFGGGAKPVEVVKLNTNGIEWLKAHPAQPMVAAPGTGGRVGNGPRD
jgi:hypothetical protein